MYAERILKMNAELGEGSIWDYQKKILYWLDIIGKKLFIYEPLSGKNSSIDFDKMITTVVPRIKGGLVVAFEDGFYFINIESGIRKKIVDPEENKPDNRFNDGKCDPSGRFWAGTMSREGKAKKGSLYCLFKNLNCSTKLQNISVSNGICWSPDKSKMYYTDTLNREIYEYDYIDETSMIKNKRIVVTVDTEDGFPDGMTIDIEGKIWVAHWGGGKVIRYDPADGTKMREILLPVTQVTSCAFGGEELDELYITTARVGLSEHELFEQKDAGSLFVCKPELKGLPAFRFNG